MGRGCLNLRHNGVQALVVLLFPVMIVLAQLAPAAAQVGGLDQLGNWEYREVYWRDSAGLPVDREFSGPLVAQYNWAYGMTVVGVNVRGVGSTDYYAALALHNSGYLDAMTVIGPLSLPVTWDAGPFHIAAGLPDGRLIVWLTAPGELPRELQFSSSYQPNTGFDVTVYTPEQANTKWGEWWITGAYQISGGDQSVAVENQDGNGSLISSLGLIGVPGVLESIAYLDYPVGGDWMPFVMMTVARDELQEPGNNEHLLALAAYYDSEGGWYLQNLRNAGIDNGAVYCGYDEQAQLLLAYDESDEFSVTGGLQQVSFTNPAQPSVGISLNGFDHLPVAAEFGLWSYFDSARTSLPMVVASGGTDVYLGHYAPRAGRIGSELGYSFFRLYQGEARGGSDRPVAQYPVVGVAATSHWSTGDPEVFWVQKGSPNHAGGQLYRMQFIPPARQR